MKIEMVIQENVTLEQIKVFKPKTIFYGANTCWWTHDPGHLNKTKVNESEIRASAEVFRLNAHRPDDPLDEYLVRARRVHSTGLPCDPMGGMLFQTDNIDGFLKSAEENAKHYGKHGLRAFIAAHHSNCFGAPVDRSDLPAIYVMPHFASSSWDDYNDAIDRLDLLTKSREHSN